MTSNKEPGDFLPLTPRFFHLLLALAEGPSHGYEMMKQVRHLSTGKVKIGPGTLYESIQRLSSHGLIKKRKARPGNDSRRIDYEITDLGAKVLEAEAVRLAELVTHATAIGVLRTT